MNPLILRRDAAQATLARFKGKPLAYGTNDCARMTALHLRRLGYRLGADLFPKAGSYSSLLGAKKQLAARGFSDLPEALDAVGLLRSTLAYVVVADIIAVPGGDGLTALWIAMGNGRALGWHEDVPEACLIEPRFADAVIWKADPRG